MTDIGGPMTAQGGPISYQCGYMTDRSGPTANGPASCMAGPLADNPELERTRSVKLPRHGLKLGIYRHVFFNFCFSIFLNLTLLALILIGTYPSFLLNTRR